ncbi:MAG: hypothetical protein ACRD5M_13405 [Candidatus Acidiferrales bacterium]
MRTKFLSCSAAHLALFLILVTALTGANVTLAGGDVGRVHWKLTGDSQLKLDGKAPLTWNVYLPEKQQKKNNLVLVLLGHRYLAIDFKAKLVYQVLPSDLKAEGFDFDSGDLFKDARLVPSGAWTVRDVGPAELIKFTLNDYGRQVEVLLRHTPDLRQFY